MLWTQVLDFFAFVWEGAGGRRLQNSVFSVLRNAPVMLMD